MMLVVGQIAYDFDRQAYVLNESIEDQTSASFAKVRSNRDQLTPEQLLRFTKIEDWWKEQLQLLSGLTLWTFGRDEELSNSCRSSPAD